MAGVGGEKSRHPDYLLASITQEQWVGWQLYSKHFGTPRIRGDAWTAITASAATPLELRKRLKPDTYIIKWGYQRKRKSTEEMKTAAAIFAALDKRGKK